jgi:hypothetical protein
MKNYNKKTIILLCIFSLSIASIFAATGEESRTFNLEIYGTLSDSEPEINIKYNSSYLVESEKIDAFDFGNTSQQFTDIFSMVIGAYDIKDPRILNIEIAAGPFYLYDGDNTTILLAGETPNITIIEKSGHALTPGDPYTATNKAFSFILPSGYYSKSEYTFFDFKFDITPGSRNYLAGSYISTITISLSAN